MFAYSDRSHNDDQLDEGFDDSDEEEEEDKDDNEEEEKDPSNDKPFVMRSERQGENERIDLPKLTSFHVEGGFTFLFADSFLFSSFAKTLSLSNRLACSC